MEILASIHNVPINSAVLKQSLPDLKYPRNKISDLEKSGVLIRLKKDVYIQKNLDYSRELIANHLYGISYVSLETALAFYGMIPERVYAVRSMTMKRAKTFSTPIGTFEYKTVSSAYFSIGLKVEIVDNQYAFIIATPTKAVCDMIVGTPHLRLQSVRAMYDYLIEDLRIDFDEVMNMDKDIVTQCIEFGKKKIELMQLLKFLKQ